jgi:hypothetical protein
MNAAGCPSRTRSEHVNTTSKPVAERLRERPPDQRLVIHDEHA